MSSFVGITLDMERIEGAIHEFAAARDVDGPIVKEKYTEYVLIEGGGVPPATLHIYYRADGTVTLQPKVGKNQDLSRALATFIATSCLMTRYEPRPLSLSQITPEHFNALLDGLVELGYKLSPRELQYAESHVAERKKDRIFLNRYHTGKFLMQGKAGFAYATVVNTLAELCSNKSEIIQSQLDVHQIDELTADGSLQELQEVMPSAYNAIGETVRCILAPSLTFTKLKVDLTDYTAFVMPALRGLEGYLKQLLLNHEMLVNPKVGFGDFFTHSKFKSGPAATINCSKTVCCIESCYRVFENHRNGLFHADGTPEISRIIETREEANAIIYQVIHTIENGHAAILNNNA